MKQKNPLHWPNYIALQWLLRVLCLDPGGYDMDMYLFFLPDRPTPTFQDRKRIHRTWQFFFYFKHPTDRLGKIGSSLIRHSRNQPTVALFSSKNSIMNPHESKAGFIISWVKINSHESPWPMNLQCPDLCTSVLKKDSQFQKVQCP